MKCKKSDGTIVTVTWRLFYASCPKVSQNCSGSSAYVAAVTVCQQSLF